MNMVSSAPEAIRIFNKWVQDKAHLRLIMSLNSVSLSLLGAGSTSSATLDDNGTFAVHVDGFEIRFLVDDAEFEYQEPAEADLASIGLSVANCVCCLTICFRDRLKPRLGLADAFLMICELRGFGMKANQ
jgi:hypothetical protein